MAMRRRSSMDPASAERLLGPGRTLVDATMLTLALGFLSLLTASLSYLVVSRRLRDSYLTLAIWVIPEWVSAVTTWITALSRAAQEYAMLGSYTFGIPSGLDAAAGCLIGIRRSVPAGLCSRLRSLTAARNMQKALNYVRKTIVPPLMALGNVAWARLIFNRLRMPESVPPITQAQEGVRAVSPALVPTDLKNGDRAAVGGDPAIADHSRMSEKSRIPRIMLGSTFTVVSCGSNCEAVAPRISEAVKSRTPATEGPVSTDIKKWEMVLALAAALTAYHAFRRYDVYYPSVHAVLLLGSAIIAALLISSSSNASSAGILPTLRQIIPTYLFCLGSSILSYRLSPLHPLARYPGPYLRRVSHFVSACIVAPGNRCRHFDALCRKYGDIVRTGSELLRDGNSNNVWSIIGDGMSVYLGRIPGAAGPLNKLLESGSDFASKRIGRGSHTRDLFHYLDTTSVALTSIFYCVLTHPAVYGTLQVEIDKFCPPGEDVNASGDVLLDAAMCLHRDPRNFSLSLSFWPERRLIASGQLRIEDARFPSSPSPGLASESDSKSPTFTWRENGTDMYSEKPGKVDLVHNDGACTPFSYGPMNCTGKGLAMLDMRTAVAALLQRFEVRLREGWDPASFEREHKDYFSATRPELPVVLRLQCRNFNAAYERLDASCQL
ncbi:hypothetical protein C8T65DRAFT_694743 [Cerioporus squamosus]|nr:hypothetical protein C8T65DRAFT_694743 [Cerioporus squamosus]